MPCPPSREHPCAHMSLALLGAVAQWPNTCLGSGVAGPGSQTGVESALCRAIETATAHAGTFRIGDHEIGQECAVRIASSAHRGSGARHTRAGPMHGWMTSCRCSSMNVEEPLAWLVLIGR